MSTPRELVDEVLGRAMRRDIWSGNYDKALPLSVQDFELTALLPAVFYMFRFGHRRGKGSFVAKFGGESGTPRERKRAATVDRVAGTFIDDPAFGGFAGSVGRAILGDLFLCFCLENAKRALGRTEQVMRVAPAHYMASWVDLPEDVSHLRYVPEMIVAMLASQKGDYVQQNLVGDPTWFAVGRGFEDNLLLRAFHDGVVRQGELASRTADRFEEATPVGLDQLLMIRLAQHLESAPDKVRGGQRERISNQRPIADRASEYFSEDIRRFVRAYSEVIPRHAFVDLLESCIAVGLTAVVTSVIEVLFAWADTGDVLPRSNQRPFLIFVDCSSGIDRRLRAIAEQSMDDFMRQTVRLPVVLMALRILDHGARHDPKLRNLKVSTRPYATDWLRLLGELLFDRRDEAKPILYEIDRKCSELADRLRDEYPEAAQTLLGDGAQSNPVWRMAESLTALQGRKDTQSNLFSLIDSAFMTGRPNGLAVKRTTSRRDGAGRAARRGDQRSLVFTDSVLDYLVHRQVLRTGKAGGSRPLPFRDFISGLFDRYGFCIDVPPRGMTISNDLLQANRSVLERRLRDLGLLVGVNDAEAMKHVEARFVCREGEHGLD